MSGDTLNLYNSDEYLGKVLVNKGVLTPEQLAETIKARDVGSKSAGLGEYLIQRGLIASQELLQTYVLQPGSSESKSGTLEIHLSGQTPQPLEVSNAARDPKKVFGKYILTNELGRGGFAVVFKAWDSFLRQYVALKLLKTQEKPSDTVDEGATQQEIQDFYREAHICVKMRHPNFVHVYEVGAIDNRLFISMEFIDGPNFFELIHGGKDRRGDTYFPLEPEKFIRMMRDVALAVDYAHNQSPPLIHRDLKPHNILVDRKGHVYVADLGLVKEASEEKSNTMTGVVKGTPEYLAPEQAEGKSKEIDARTDIWQLGIILYEIMVGRTPFWRGDGDMMALLRAICHDEPPRPNEGITRSLAEKPDGTHRPKAVPKQLETICLKAIEKKKYHRYSTAKELADDLDRYLNSQEIIAQEPSVRRRIVRRIQSRPLLWGSLAALLLAGAVGAAVFLVRGPADPSSLIVKRADEQRAARSWHAFRGAVGDLRTQAPGHPELPRLQKDIALHDAEHATLEKEWERLLGLVKSDPAAIRELEPTYKGCEELKEKFRIGLTSALTEAQDTVRSRARELVGDGQPHDRWVNEPVKQDARKLLGKIALLSGLKDHALFPFAAKPELASDRKALESVVAYLGTWQLQANVLPFAELVLFRGDQELARDQTPLGLKSLEVPEGKQCRVELYWPSRNDPRVKLTKDLTGLHHGGVIVLSGDMKSGELQVDSR